MSCGRAFYLFSVTCICKKIGDGLKWNLEIQNLGAVVYNWDIARNVGGHWSRTKRPMRSAEVAMSWVTLIVGCRRKQWLVSWPLTQGSDRISILWFFLFFLLLKFKNPSRFKIFQMQDRPEEYSFISLALQAERYFAQGRIRCNG